MSVISSVFKNQFISENCVECSHLTPFSFASCILYIWSVLYLSTVHLKSQIANKAPYAVCIYLPYNDTVCGYMQPTRHSVHNQIKACIGTFDEVIFLDINSLSTHCFH